MLKDMLKAGLYLNNPELAKIVADQSRCSLIGLKIIRLYYIKLNFHGGGHSSEEGTSDCQCVRI